MASDEGWAKSAVELAAAVRDKDVSSVELLDGFVERVDRLDPTLDAVVTLDVDRARETAAAADDAAVRGEWLGPLHGLPVTIKDALATAAIRTTSNGVELRDLFGAGRSTSSTDLMASGRALSLERSF